MKHPHVHAGVGFVLVAAVIAAVHYAFGERVARVLVGVLLIGIGVPVAGFFVYVMYRVVMGTI